MTAPVDLGRRRSSGGAGTRPVRVALDLLGGDDAPEVAVAAVGSWLAGPGGRDAVELVLVGPPQPARARLEALGADPDDPALSYVPAAQGVAMHDAPIAAARSSADVGVRVAAELVAAGRADVLVTAGHTGAAVVATSLAWGRESGVARPVLSVALPGSTRPVLLLDAGASLDASPEVLLSHAAAGLRRARELGFGPAPRVGLLSIGAESGKGDELRRATDPLLRAALGPAYVGPVEGDDVVDGSRAEVVVTDGFTGNVLLKGLEGAVRWTVAVAGAAYHDPDPAAGAVGAALAAPYGAAVLLGVRGVAVLAHGAASPDAVVTAIAVAVATVRAPGRVSTVTGVQRASGARR